MRIALVAIIMALACPLPASAIEPNHGGQVDFVPGQFVATQATPNDRYSADGILGYRIIEVEPNGDPLDQAAELGGELGFEVLPMVLYQLMDDPTTEPLFSEQWSLQNTGQTGGSPSADIDVVPAWDWTLGKNTVIAVVDSGVDPNHPDMQGHLWTNPAEIPDNGEDDDGNGFVDDLTGWDFAADDADTVDSAGHGTGVASVAVAAVDGAGMAGVAPDAVVMVIRACDDFGCPAAAVAAGLVYAVDNGADVVNLSLGSPGVDPLVTAAVEYAAAHDVLIVCAAGNGAQEVDASNPWTPISIDAPNLVAVASTTASDTLSWSSNYGADVELAAPGDQVLTAAIGQGYEIRSGTSFAAPHVAGVAALMESLDPDLSAGEAADLLSAYGAPVPGLDGVVASGKRLDARRTVQAARFRDIPESEFADDVMWAGTQHITTGCDDNRFCPRAIVTRGQMAAFLRRALSLPLVPTDTFTDDDASAFESDIDAIAATGITKGCTDTRFCPDDPVTRAQMAAFIVRAFGLPSAATGAFADDDGSVFEPDIDALAAAGITVGCDPPSNLSFCPEALVTRGQMAALLHRTPG